MLMHEIMIATIKISIIFVWLINNQNNKKSGTLSQNEMDSALVGLSVLISNFLKNIIRPFKAK
jgi:hypothetical protein